MPQETLCPTCNFVIDKDSDSMQLKIESSFTATQSKINDLLKLDCVICGKYSMAHSFYKEHYCPILSDLSNVKRATLSHYIAISNLNGKEPCFSKTSLQSIISEHQLPPPATQVVNLIRYIGDKQSLIGFSIANLPINFVSIIGAPNMDIALNLIEQMRNQNLISYHVHRRIKGQFVKNIDLGLTLRGWELYESEKRGRIAGKYGFVAFQFNNTDFPKVLEFVKPKIQSEIGYDIIDMGIEKSVGTIDNIMRTRIREAAFVIADLSDDNHGAYWEAGFADGLGKPVIYVCEESKFNERGTHFDTNHQMTIMWNVGNLQTFYQKLEGAIKELLKI